MVDVRGLAGGLGNEFCVRICDGDVDDLEHRNGGK
jgi:hypothetical protein